MWPNAHFARGRPWHKVKRDARCLAAIARRLVRSSRQGQHRISTMLPPLVRSAARMATATSLFFRGANDADNNDAAGGRAELGVGEASAEFPERGVPGPT